MDPARQPYASGIHLADNIVRRDQFAAFQNRVDELPRDWMLDDGITVFVMQPVVELVSSGKAVDDGSVRLCEFLWIVRDWGRSGNHGRPGHKSAQRKEK